MKFSLKNKLRAGLIFIFGLMFFVVVASHYYLYHIASQTRDIFKANYETLDFLESMRDALDPANAGEQPDMARFDEALKRQEANITEQGEAEATLQLRMAFDTYRQIRSDTARRQMLLQLAQISALNRAAVVRKNADALKSAEDASVGLAILGTVCTLLAFTFLFNFPDYIANPIARLTEGIRRISEKNYGERIHDNATGDEFGEMTEAFNTMAAQLDAYERSSLAQVMEEKRRLETVLSMFPEAVLGFDDQQKILFVNPNAEKLLGFTQSSAVGKYGPDLALHNDLLRALLKQTDNTAPLRIFADGRESFFKQETFAVYDAKGEHSIGQFIVLKNITLLEEKAVQAHNERIALYHELKRHFRAVDESLAQLETTVQDPQKHAVAQIRAETAAVLAAMKTQ